MISFQQDTDRALFENALAFAKKQVGALAKKHPDFYPMYTKKGKWKHDGAAWTHWCDGFLPGMMWIFEKRSEEKEEKGKTIHRIERRSGSFSRTVTLPCEVTAKEVAAEYTNGVLSVVLPKCEKSRPNKITVKG